LPGGNLVDSAGPEQSPSETRPAGVSRRWVVGGGVAAAAAAGLQTIVLAREGVEVNTTECPIARSFDEIVLKRPV